MASWSLPLCAALIVIAGAAVYSNSLSGPFILDDAGSIADNPTIRDLRDLGTTLSPPGDGRTVQGRPLVNLSLALNYALGGLDVRGYHVFNLSIHLLNALTLFGVVRWTLSGTSPRRDDARSLALALAATLLWITHPLCTASVTYVVQRAEALMALFYLLTLYCTIRSAHSAVGHRAALWQAAAVASCWLGMASKEVMVTAPFVVLLYDRIFLTGSFRESLRRRKWLYAGLVASLALLAGLTLGAGSRGSTAGFSGSVSSWDYARTQLVAIATYLRLAFWPHPLVFDYGMSLRVSPREIWPGAALMAALVLATLVSLRRWPRAGFLGVAFLAVLAPSSSVVPVLTQTMAEHRFYLPLAIVLVATVLAVQALAERLASRIGAAGSGRDRQIIVGALVASVAATLGYLTIARNADYRSGQSIWEDTIAKRPDNPRAHNNLGRILAGLGRHAEAMGHFRQALLLAPDPVHAADAHNDVAISLHAQGRYGEAVEQFNAALRSRQDFPEAHNNLGNSLRRLGRHDEAMAHYQKALHLKPRYSAAHENLATSLLRLGRFSEALPHLDEALRGNPQNGQLYNNRAVAYFSLGDHERARADVLRAQRLGYQPDPQFLHQLESMRRGGQGYRRVP